MERELDENSNRHHGRGHDRDRVERDDAVDDLDQETIPLEDVGSGTPENVSVDDV